MGSLHDFKMLKEPNDAKLEDFKKLIKINQNLSQQLSQKNKKIILLERKLRKTSEIEEQREWLLNELTKKISKISEMRSDILKHERFSVIGELSSRLAHDMRNPLSIVLNSLSIIKIKHYKKLPPDVIRLFLIIERASSRMAFHLDELLNFVRQSPMTTENKSLLEIIQSSISRIVLPSGISISTPKNDAILNCDPRKLEAAFSNLFMNAIQAMENKGTIMIRIKDNEDWVTVEIQDSGPGMPEDILDKIFEPLFTTKSQGTGLGLPSVKRLVEQHGGKISVRLNPTVFSINFPHNNSIHNS